MWTGSNLSITITSKSRMSWKMSVPERTDCEVTEHSTSNVPKTSIVPESTNCETPDLTSIENAIETNGLSKIFGELRAVDSVSFSVRKGEIFGFLGPNGAGKTTTIRMLCTLSTPSEGSASVAGLDVVKQDGMVREKIGLVSEKMIMYDQLTAFENLRFFGKLYNIPKSKLDPRINELLELVHLEKWAHKQIGTFSTGMKQRINVIRALLNNPEILFLDEPTLGLDPQSTSEIREFIRNVNTKNGTSIILTTHMMVEADMLCDRIGIIDRGKIVALDTPGNLKKMISSSDGEVMEFDITNLTSAMYEAIQEVDCVDAISQKSDTLVRVTCKGNDAFDNLIDTIRESNGKIKSVKNLEPTLEDVFLHITGREVRDHTSAKVKTSSGRHGHMGRPKSRVR